MRDAPMTYMSPSSYLCALHDMAVVILLGVNLDDPKARGTYESREHPGIPQFSPHVQHHQVDDGVRRPGWVDLPRLDDEHSRLWVIGRKGLGEVRQDADAELVGPVEQNAADEVHQGAWYHQLSGF